MLARTGWPWARTQPAEPAYTPRPAWLTPPQPLPTPGPGRRAQARRRSVFAQGPALLLLVRAPGLRTASVEALHPLPGKLRKGWWARGLGSAHLLQSRSEAGRPVCLGTGRETARVGPACLRTGTRGAHVRSEIGFLACRRPQGEGALPRPQGPRGTSGFADAQRPQTPQAGASREVPGARATATRSLSTRGGEACFSAYTDAMQVEPPQSASLTAQGSTGPKR